MTPEEYSKKIQELNNDHLNKKRAVDWEFAHSNKIADVGDTIIDHSASVIIESIGLSYHGRMPTCNYKGKNLIKSGKQSKREPIRVVWGPNANKVLRNGKVIWER